MRISGFGRYALVVVMAVAMLAGCGQLAPLTNTPRSATGETPGATHAKPVIYVANNLYRAASLTAYARNAKHNAKALRTIAGSNTLIVQPEGIAVDSRGYLYVANLYGGGTSGNGNILVFAPNANGNIAPIATISQDVYYPFGIALDSSGNVYVANWQGGSITEYAAGSYQLMRKIQGAYTGLYPVGVTIDSEGRIYAVNNCGCSSSSPTITVYASTADKDARPLRTIGPESALYDPRGGIAVDSRGEIMVTSAGYTRRPGVLVFARRARGLDKPSQTISGSKTQITSNVNGLALDGVGSIYVGTSSGSSGVGSVLVFAPNAKGNVPPSREITGTKTGLVAPAGIAVR
jgi:sugar lactone lactonase YvrE